MKILQLGKFYPILGGVEKVMWDLTRGLAAEGFACDMLCASHEPSKEQRIISLGEKGRCIVLPSFTQASGTMICPEMIGWVRRHAADYDLIHIHHPDPMACLALRMSGFKGRVILHWHSDILKNKAILAAYKPLQSWLIKRADKIVGTTPVYISQSPALQKVQDKVTYVPIGIDPVVYDSEKQRPSRLAGQGKRLFTPLDGWSPIRVIPT